MSLFDSASLVVTPSGYKEDKLYSIKPTDGSGDLLVTRATTATRVNSAGLIEPSPYNLLTYSEDFTNGWYAYLGSISATANYGVAPNGTTTSTRVLFTSTNQILAKNITGLTGKNGVFSLWIKGTTGKKIAITYGGIDNLVTLQSGWNRFNVQGLATIDFVFITTFGADTLDIEVWGGQVELGTSAKEYFPTTDRLNVPRLDYTNSTCPSILVEPQRTNVATYSEQFDNAAWSTKDNLTITANATTAPDGTTTADKLVENTSNSTHRVFRTLGGTNNVFSFYAKAGERSWVSVLTFSSYAYFNVSNGTLGSIPAGTTATITNAGNGWYRCTLTNFHPTFTLIGISTANNVTSYLGDGTSGLYVWGAQVEAGSYATSYIPTVASSVTRNADVISKTGISSLIGQTEGTMFIDINYTADSVFKNLFNLGTSTSSYIAIVARSNNKIGAEVLNAGVQVNTESTTVYTSQRLKIAFAYKANDFAMYVNGVLAFSQSSGTVPAKAEVYLGSYGNGSWQPKDGINSAALWKTRLTNTELASFTTI